MKGNITKKLFTPLKISAAIALAALSFNASADVGYVGNPDRPDTFWVPGHCDGHCWNEGYYVKIMKPDCVDCSDLVWVDGMNDAYGNWIPAHYELKRYVVINGQPEHVYPGYAI